MVVDQFVEPLFPAQEIRGSSPDNGKINSTKCTFK